MAEKKSWGDSNTKKNKKNTLEDYGGDTESEDNGPAFQRFFDDSFNSHLSLGLGTYKIKTPVYCKKPVSITGQGTHSMLNARDSTVFEGALTQRMGTVILDNRNEDSDEFLLNFENNDNYPVSNVNISNLSIVGAAEQGCGKRYKTRGILLGHISWNSYYNNIMISGFAKEAISGLHADSFFSNIQVLRCGGKIGNEIYYAIDMSEKSGNPNFNNFTGLHVEHCRYILKLAGMFNTFTSCHFETNKGISIDQKSNYPFILLKDIRKGNKFISCDFISPYSEDFFVGDNSNEPCYYIQGDFKHEVAGSVNDSSISFYQCDFTVGNETLSSINWLDIKKIPTIINSCNFFRSSSINSPIRIAGKSIINSCRIELFPERNRVSDAYHGENNNFIIHNYGDLIITSCMIINLGGSKKEIINSNSKSAISVSSVLYG